MSAAVLQHPAVAVATRVAHTADPALVPVALSARDEIAAVLLESPEHRLVVFVPCESGSWVAPGMSGGSRRPVSQPRLTQTGDVSLTGVSVRGFCGAGPDRAPAEFGWFAVVGQAALDAVEVSLISSVETVTEVIGEDGVAFTLVRTRMLPAADGEIPGFERPELRILTRDGRSVSMYL